MDIETELALYEKACLAYARDARTMREGECDRHAMVAAFLVLRSAYAKDYPPQTTYVTTEEGGAWRIFNSCTGRGVYAIKFANGRTWDSTNGWRGT